MMPLDGSGSPVDRWLRAPRFAEDRQRYLGALMDLNAAHVVMLREVGLITAAAAAALARAIDRVRRDPSLLDQREVEDLYFAGEAAIIEVAGEDAGGQLHIGRSRNDLTATMTKLVAREAGDQVQRRLLDVIRALADLASAHTGTLMPGYTHLRPAQPTTLGHYVVGVAWALRRDFGRLADARRRTDESPMGAAAFAGTGFAIDRARVADLMGFARPAVHTQDAVASRDGVFELLAGFALTAGTMARWIQDWYVWSTPEFGFLTLDPSITGGSSIMPQKQNPNVLERTRAKSAHVTAALLDALMAAKGTGFMHSQDMSVESVTPFWQAARETEAMLEVGAHLLRSVTVNVPRLLERSTSGFTMATEVADELVRTRAIPFRTAHGIVAQAVRGAAEGDLAGFVAQLNKAGSERGRALAVTAEEVRTWMDPAAAVARRRRGGPAAEEVGAQLAELTRWLELAEQGVDRDRQRIATAAAERARALAAILAAGEP